MESRCFRGIFNTCRVHQFTARKSLYARQVLKFSKFLSPLRIFAKGISKSFAFLQSIHVTTSFKWYYYCFKRCSDYRAPKKILPTSNFFVFEKVITVFSPSQDNLHFLITKLKNNKKVDKIFILHVSTIILTIKFHFKHEIIRVIFTMKCSLQTPSSRQITSFEVRVPTRNVQKKKG